MVLSSDTVHSHPFAPRFHKQFNFFLTSCTAMTLRTFTKNRPHHNCHKSKSSSYTIGRKSCPLCTALQGKSDYWLSECQSLPNGDRRFVLKAQISDIVHKTGTSDVLDEENSPPEEGQSQASLHQWRFSLVTTPSHSLQTVDTGATGNMIKEDIAIRLGLAFSPPINWPSLVKCKPEQWTMQRRTRERGGLHNSLYDMSVKTCHFQSQP